MRDMIGEMVAYTNVCKILLLNQTMRTAQLYEQVKCDKEALELAKSTIDSLNQQLSECVEAMEESCATIAALTDILGMQTSECCDERYG